MLLYIRAIVLMFLYELTLSLLDSLLLFPFSLQKFELEVQRKKNQFEQVELYFGDGDKTVGREL
jgi:hypothetical protein